MQQLEKCGGPSCTKTAAEVELQKCAQCRTVAYCCKECQREHWLQAHNGGGVGGRRWHVAGLQHHDHFVSGSTGSGEAEECDDQGLIPGLQHHDHFISGSTGSGEAEECVDQGLLPVGFWRRKADELCGELPLPVRGEAPPYSSLVLPLVERYLTAGALLESYEHGYSSCRICGLRNGCCTLTDGTYCWPEGYLHYIVAHNVALPQTFLNAILGALAARQGEPCSGEVLLRDPCRLASLCAAAEALLPLRNHLLYDPIGGPPTQVPAATRKWLSMHSTLQMPG